MCNWTGEFFFGSPKRLFLFLGCSFLDGVPFFSVALFQFFAFFFFFVCVCVWVGGWVGGGLLFLRGGGLLLGPFFLCPPFFPIFSLFFEGGLLLGPFVLGAPFFVVEPFP